MPLSVYSNALEMIGHTPLLAVRRLDTGPCQLFLKLENQNPGGSIKDRIGLYLIEAAEREGQLKPGGTLIEATAGNTGLGLALVAGQKGYRLMLVIPDKMSQEKIFHLKAMGAEVRLTRSDVQQGSSGVLPGLRRRASPRETPGSLLREPIRQPGQPPGPRGNHRPRKSGSRWATTWTRSFAAWARAARSPALSRYFARVAPNVEMVLADPVGSVAGRLRADGAVGKAGARGWWKASAATRAGRSRTSRA